MRNRQAFAISPSGVNTSRASVIPSPGITVPNTHSFWWVQIVIKYTPG